MDTILPIKPDLLAVFPRHTDFPLFRKYIHENRARFAKVILVFTDMSVDEDNRIFIQEAMKSDDISFCNADKARADQDWRSLAVNKGLDISTAGWVLFTEQDFIVHDADKFWAEINDRINNNHLDAYIYVEGERPHPAFMMVRREFVDKTQKNFGLIPNKGDHFSIFFDDLQKAGGKYGFFNDQGHFHHMSGLSQNMYLLQSDQVPNFRPEQFKAYLEDCLSSGMTLLPQFESLAKEYINGSN